MEGARATMTSKTKLNNFVWTLQSQVIVDYREKVLTTITVEEEEAFEEALQRLEEYRIKLKTAVDIFEKIKNDNKMVKPNSDAVTWGKAFDKTIKIRNKYEYRLDVESQNELLTAETKNLLALEFIERTEGLLYRHAISSLPDEVLMQWDKFAFRGPQPAPNQKDFSQGLLGRKPISMQILSYVANLVHENVIIELFYSNFESNISLEDKIHQSHVLVTNFSDNEQVMETATPKFNAFLNQYKQENDLENLPDSWVLDIVLQLV